MILIRNRNNPIWDSLIQLRVSALYKIALLAGACGWLTLAWSLWPVVGETHERHLMRPVSLFILIIAVLSYLLIERDIILAAFLQLTGVLVSIISAVGIFHSIDAVHLFAVPVILASVLLGQRAVLVTTFTAVAFNFLMATQWLALPWQSFVLPTAILILITVAVIISTRSLYTALWWALDGFEMARHNQDIARERKAELEQVLKSLDVATHNLRRLNYALSLAQQRADDARQLKQQFAQTISHELRTPLNLIVGFTESMIQSPEYYGEPLPPRYLRDLSIVYRNADHLQSLVNDVLDLARIEAAQMTLQVEQHLASVFIEDIVQMAQSMVETQNLTFKADIAPDLPDIWMDSIRIKQVVYNLLSNAVRFTREGSITLRVRHQLESIRFEVIDTGIGIDTANLDRIFEPFCQVENPMRRRVGGAGLGLPISRQLVEMHGGRLEVTSEPGSGSTFYFELPLRSSALESSANGHINPPVRPFQVQEDNILIVVTRSPSGASLISRYLDSYRTIVAQDLDEALATMNRLIPQAVIVDTNSVAVDIQQTAQHPLLAQTLMISCPLPGEAPLSRHLAANGYLIKPVSRESLWNMLRQFDSSVERVLVADDDPDFVRMIERMLDSPLRRFQIDRAHSGKETLLKIAHNHPDLLLLDLQMPDVDGFQVMARLRSSPRLQDIPVVVVSAQEEFDLSTASGGPLTITRSQGISPLDLVHWLQGLLK